MFSYKHAIDGMARVAREEGFTKLFSGVDWATSRAVSTHLKELLLRRNFKLPCNKDDNARFTTLPALETFF